MLKDELAVRKWLAIPSSNRKQLENNVYCGNCGVTTIVDYEVDSASYRVVLSGRCKDCKEEVTRVVS